MELFVGDAGQDGRVGDLVAVEVQDRQHDTVGARVDELVGLPAGRPAGRSQLRRRRRWPERTGSGCSSQHRRRETGRNPARHLRGWSPESPERSGTGCRRVGELAEELLQTSFVLGDLREGLGVGAVQVGLGGTAGPPWPGPMMITVFWPWSAMKRLMWPMRKFRPGVVPQWPTRRCFTSCG